MRIIGVLLWIVVVACQSATGPSSRPGPVDEVFVARIDTTALPGLLHSPSSVRAFYERRDFSLFWVDAKGLSPSADSLLRLISALGATGLDPDQYHNSRLSLLLRDTVHAPSRIDADILLSDAWIALHSHLNRGRLDPTSYQPVSLHHNVDTTAIDALSRTSANTVVTVLREREPAASQYRQLRNTLESLLSSEQCDTTGGANLAKIAINLERLRWQNPFPSRYVSVNIPALMLRVRENDSVTLETPVIVGKRATPTPILESEITSFIIYPYWHAPKSIATREILPILLRDSTYLESHRFEVLDRDGTVLQSDTIQWERYSQNYFPFILRQREGEDNAMGIIKFDFSNSFGVYLHDTNSRRLFKRKQRALSHGCVRVSDAIGFARYLVKDDDVYVSPEDLDQYLSLQQRMKITLRRPMPLRLEYFTAEVVDGALVIYEDIYGKDEPLLKALIPHVDSVRTIAMVGP